VQTVTEAADRHAKASRLLFSREWLFSRIAADGGSLTTLQKSFDVTVILFTREFLAHAISSYGQAVKRGGCTKSLGKYLPGSLRSSRRSTVSCRPRNATERTNRYSSRMGTAGRAKSWVLPSRRWMCWRRHSGRRLPVSGHRRRTNPVSRPGLLARSGRWPAGSHTAFLGTSRVSGKRFTLSHCQSVPKTGRCADFAGRRSGAGRF